MSGSALASLPMLNCPGLIGASTDTRSVLSALSALCVVAVGWVPPNGKLSCFCKGVLGVGGVWENGRIQSWMLPSVISCLLPPASEGWVVRKDVSGWTGSFVSEWLSELSTRPLHTEWTRTSATDTLSGVAWFPWLLCVCCDGVDANCSSSVRMSSSFAWAAWKNAQDTLSQIVHS